MAAVNLQGLDLDDALTARFGLDLAQVRSVARRFFPPAQDARVTG
jgi:hypothetical protein